MLTRRSLLASSMIVALCLAAGAASALLRERDPAIKGSAESARTQAPLAQSPTRSTSSAASTPWTPRPIRPPVDSPPDRSIAADAPPAPSADMEEPTDEELALAEERSFLAEARSERWSQETESRLEVEFASIVPGNGTVDGIECRTTQCRVGITWPDEADFQADSMTTLHESGRILPCARSIFLDRESRSASLYFKCNA